MYGEKTLCMEATEKAYFCYKYIMFDMDACSVSARCWLFWRQDSSAWLTAALRWLQLQETKCPHPWQSPAPTALVQGQWLVPEAGPTLFSSAMSPSHAQMSNSHSVAGSMGKEGRFSRGCGALARRKEPEEGAGFSPARDMTMGG